MNRQHLSLTTAWLSLSALVLLAPGTALAQRAGSSPVMRLGISAPAPQGEVTSGKSIRIADDERKSGTYWLHGGIIGGLLLGTTMYLVNGASGEDYDESGRAYHWTHFAGWGTVGFLGGMLVGGQFSKHD